MYQTMLSCHHQTHTHTTTTIKPRNPGSRLEAQALRNGGSEVQGHLAHKTERVQSGHTKLFFPQTEIHCLAMTGASCILFAFKIVLFIIICFLFFPFQPGSHCVDLTDLELSM